jgi:hypothetical protein
LEESLERKASRMPTNTPEIKYFDEKYIFAWPSIAEKWVEG